MLQDTENQGTTPISRIDANDNNKCKKTRLKEWSGHWALVGIFVLAVLYTFYFARIFLI